ncbi:MAG: hypothetical protein KDD12_25250 [Lewinella sp.]|nr:hypothetical protein [Lewinella sp.]
MKLGKNLFMLVFGLTLLTTSCQKEDLTQTAPVDEPAAQQSLEDFTLEQVYGIPPEAMTEKVRQELYAGLTANATDQEIADLRTLMQNLQKQKSEPRNRFTFRTPGNEETISAGNPGDGFGTAVATDGNYLFAGAPEANQVHVYLDGGRGYVETQVLTPGNGAETFGSALAVSGDWLAVSAPFGPADQSGQIFVFHKEGASWVEHQILTMSGNYLLGKDVVLKDGQLAATVFTPANISSGAGINSIVVYNLNGNNWSQSTILGDGTIFFWDIDMDGNRIVGNGGHVFPSPIIGILNPKVFVYTGSGSSWSAPEELSLLPGQLLFRAVAIEGNTIVGNAASPGNLSSVFRYTGRNWSNVATVSYPPVFGQTKWLDISGSTISVSFPELDQVYLFEGSGSTWTQTGTLSPGQGGSDVFYGNNTVLAGGKIIVGAPNTSETPGMVFVYE